MTLPHSKRVVLMAVLQCLLLLGCSQEKTPLEERVARFWEAQLAHDRVAAQQLVAPESRNNFLRTPERMYRAWEIEKVTAKSDTEAAVRVSYEGFVEGLSRFHRLGETQVWRKIDGEWFLTLAPPAQVLEESFKKIYTPGKTEEDGTIVVGKQVKIPFFNKAQTGTVTIRNGTPEAVRITEVDLDASLFEVVEQPQEIPGLERAQIRIRHLGPDRLKNQTSSMKIVLLRGQEPEEHIVQIHYNYISPGLRGLLGLSTQEAAQLKRSDKVRPKLNVPVPEEQAERLRELQGEIRQEPHNE